MENGQGRKNCGLEEKFGPEAQERIQARAAILASELRVCSKTELEMLIRYYVHRQDAAQVIAEMRISPEQFETVRRRMRRSVSSQGPVNPPRTDAATAG